MKIAGLIVLYHPDIESIKNIRTYISEVGRLYVVDNSEPNDRRIQQELESLGYNYLYVGNEKNLGIAKALNQGAGLAFQEGYEWLLTMDQDSGFADRQFFEAARNFENPGNVAIFTQKIARPPVVVSGNHNHKETMNDKTSGNLLNLSVCMQIGGFQDDLFIDEVDTDYCFKARKRGFKIVLFENLYLIHKVGNSYKAKSPFTGKEFERHQHPPVRYYYISRNLFIVFAKYFFTFPWETTKRLLCFPRYLYGILMYENERISKLYYIFKGISHFLIGRRGKL